MISPNLQRLSRRHGATLPEALRIMHIIHIRFLGEREKSGFAATLKRWRSSPGPMYRCVNNHVSQINQINGDKTKLCPVCQQPLIWTFPEDVDGPLQFIDCDYDTLEQRAMGGLSDIERGLILRLESTRLS